MSDIKLSAEQINSVKGKGFLRDKTTPDCFNARVITVNGKVTTQKMRVVLEAADRFGNGEVAFTTRQTVEVQRIPYENIEPFCAFLEENGLMTGGTGKKVRPVVSCKGTTCVFGLADTYEISRQIHEKFYVGYHGVVLPHKFKIAVGGCPNNCVKPDLNDVGVIGQRRPVINAEACRGCNVCAVEKACPMKAVSLVGAKAQVDENICNNCGRCNKKCPFGAFEGYEDGYKIYVGGRWGKKGARGRELGVFIKSVDELMDTVEKAILFFKAYGIDGERFAETLERIGFENAERIILSDELLNKRQEILGGSN
jgi:dissimilatory sulfite reductase (desulfoviridin) alpha/beta subunit